MKCNSRIILLLLLLCLTSCEQNVADQHFNEGYGQGYAVGKKEGYASGYREAYELIHPSTDHHYSAMVGFVHQAFALLGAVKIILSIVLCCLILIEKSASNIEVAAKIMFAAMGSVVAFFSSPSLGVQTSLDSVLTSPSPSNQTGVWVIILLSAGSTYALVSLFTRLFKRIHGVKIEAWCIFLLAGLGTIILRPLGGFLFESPDVNNYLGSNFLIGVSIGGVMYLAIQLLNDAVSASLSVKTGPP